MNRFRIALAALFAAVLASSLSLAGATSAGAMTAEQRAGASISVTPATGLTNGKVVTVKGSGFGAGKLIYIVECQNKKGADFCGTNKIKTATANDNGAFTTTFTTYTGKVGKKGKCAAGATCYIIASDTVKTAVKAIKFAG